MTHEEIARRVRMVLRAFSFDKPLPARFTERMEAFDSGADRSEELWYGDYRISEDDEAPARVTSWKNNGGQGERTEGK